MQMDPARAPRANSGTRYHAYTLKNMCYKGSEYNAAVTTASNLEPLLGTLHPFVDARILFCTSTFQENAQKLESQMDDTLWEGDRCLHACTHAYR